MEILPGLGILLLIALVVGLLLRFVGVPGEGAPGGSRPCCSLPPEEPKREP